MSVLPVSDVLVAVLAYGAFAFGFEPMDTVDHVVTCADGLLGFLDIGLMGSVRAGY